MRLLLSLSLALLMLVPVPSFAEDELKPLRDYNRMTKEMRRVPRDERAAETKRRALEYLEAWKASGQTATGTARYAIAQFQEDAGLYKDAMENYRGVRTGTAAKQKSRDFAATAEANLLSYAALRNEIGMEAIDKATADLVAYAAEMTEPDRARSRGKLRGVLAILHTRAWRTKESHALRMEIIQEDNRALKTQVRPIMRGLLRQAHKMDAYDALRKEAAAAHKTITDIQSKVFLAAETKLKGAKAKLLAATPDALDADGNLKQTDRKKMTPYERAYSSAQRTYNSASDFLKSLPAYLEPFELLGKPAPKWTVEREYAEEKVTLESLKGKVVLLDFWNTWGPKCSFPVVRDMLKAYGEKGLAVMGVTAGSNIVFVSRFDFDEDHKSKIEGPKRYAFKLATEREPSNGDYILDEELYRVREADAIGQFIDNHELKWPHVLIAQDEPGPKFAQDTWPHTVILDKQGNIRYLLGGALERADTLRIAKIKKVIEDLLAE